MRFIIDTPCIFLVIYVNKHEVNFHGPLLPVTLFSNPFKKVSLGWQKNTKHLRNACVRLFMVLEIQSSPMHRFLPAQSF